MGIFKRKYPDGRESKDWYISYYVHGKQYKRKIGPNKKLAEQVLKDIEVKVIKGEYLGIHEEKKVLFKDFVEEYLGYAKVNKSLKTYELNELCARRLMETFTGYLTSITPKQIEEHKKTRREHVSPATVNREVALLKNMFTKAIEWGYAKENPVKAVKLLKEPPGRLRYLTPEEIERLLSCCAYHLRPIVITAIHTGLRKSEILNLQWSDVDFTTRTLTIRQTKNNEIKVIHMNKTLWETLHRLPRHIHSSYVFCDEEGRRFNNVKRSFGTTLKKAGIKDFRFHDMRHTFASHLVMNGVDLKTVQQLLGHRDIRMTFRYSHLSPEHVQEAVNTLDGLQTRTKQEQSPKPNSFVFPPTLDLTSRDGRI